MSRYTYHGRFENPANSYYVKPVGDLYEVWVRSPRDRDGSAPADRPHTSAPKFEEDWEAQEYIDGIFERFEEDYDDYLNEHHDEIVRMEQYEAFRNEF